MIDIGKIPPQAIELEGAVLGAIMIEKEALEIAMEQLKPDCFYKDCNRKIYEAILKLYNSNDSIDILTVKNQLKKDGTLEEVGGASYIANLTSDIGSAVHIDFHCKIIVQKYVQREIIRISSEATKMAFDEMEDVANIIEFYEKEMFEIVNKSIKKDFLHIEKIIRNGLTQIQFATKQNNEGGYLAGLPSGFSHVDNYTTGFTNGDLIIIAGRPSMGKSAFALCILRNLAIDFETPVGFFSLEMSIESLANRFISMESEIEGIRLKTGKITHLDWNRIEKNVYNIINSNIYIDDTAAIGLMELRTKARRLVAKHNVKLIAIDYMQLMSSVEKRGQNREQEVSKLSAGLKALAKELNIPIIVLSQLSRENEKRGNKRPMLSDLRDSGAIEQDADLVIFIHRPEKYNEADISLKGLAEVIIAKHRNGAIGTVNMTFKSEFAKFVDFEGNLFIKNEEF